MHPVTITCVVLIVAAGLALVGRAIARDERRKRADWRPDGYRPGIDSTATVGDWWPQPLPAVGLRQSVRVIDAPPAAEMASVADPRRIVTSRHLSAPAKGVGAAFKRARAARVRSVNAKHKQSRGAA